MQPRILYPARISFKIEGEIKFFYNKQKLEEYSNTKPILKEILKGLLKTKKKGRKRREKKEEELGWLRKPQSESSHSNKPTYRFNHEHVLKKIKLKRKKESSKS